MCESALLSAVTCLASGTFVINLTGQIHTLNTPLLCFHPLCILVKGPTEVFLGHRIVVH